MDSIKKYIKSIYPDFRIKKCKDLWYSQGTEFTVISKISAFDVQLELIYEIKHNEKMKEFLTPEMTEQLLELIKNKNDIKQ